MHRDGHTMSQRCAKVAQKGDEAKDATTGSWSSTVNWTLAGLSQQQTPWQVSAFRDRDHLKYHQIAWNCSNKIARNCLCKDGCRSKIGMTVKLSPSRRINLSLLSHEAGFANNRLRDAHMQFLWQDVVCVCVMSFYSLRSLFHHAVFCSKSKRTAKSLAFSCLPLMFSDSTLAVYLELHSVTPKLIHSAKFPKRAANTTQIQIVRPLDTTRYSTT